MIPNTNPVTGISYGYVAANHLDSELVDELMHGSQASNLSEAAAVAEEEARQRSDWENECESKSVAAQEAGTDLVLDDFEPNLDEFDSGVIEPVVEGTYEGVKYMSSWLGGALNFYIIESPMIATTASRASPCVPNAGILYAPYTRSGDVLCYDCPPGWWAIDPPDRSLENFAAQFESPD